MCKIDKLVGSCCTAQGAQLGALWGPRGVGCGGGREAQKGGHVYTVVGDSYCCTTKTNTTL